MNRMKRPAALLAARSRGFSAQSTPAKLVKRLRDATSAPLMECKRALQASDNDFAQATKILKAKGLEAAQKKSGRQTSEGRIGFAIDSDVVSLVIVECETDFVSSNEVFQKAVHDVAREPRETQDDVVRFL